MKNWALVLTLLLAGCAGLGLHSKNLVVLDYQDFGPQVIARNMIGLDWWQWLPHGSTDAADYPVKVVVYRNVPLEEVQQRYPTIPDREQDYRYLTYSEAMAYFDRNITDNLFPDATERMEQTRQRILQRLGSQ